MRRLLVPLALLASLAAGAQPAAAAGLDRTDFRYQRPLVEEVGGEPVLIEPDGPIFEHSLPGFADLRVADAPRGPVPSGESPRPRRCRS
jgi:hypothetical protein